MVVGENYLSTPLVISSDVIHLELKTKTDSEENGLRTRWCAI